MLVCNVHALSGGCLYFCVVLAGAAVPPSAGQQTLSA